MELDINPESFVLGTLADDAFVQVNKKILRFMKGDGSAAIFLGELISMYKYNRNNQTLDPDDSFLCLTRRIQYAIGLSEYKQHRILEKFKDAKLVTVELKGFPATRYVTINFPLIAKILAADDQKHKKIESQQFYNDINTACNALLGAKTVDPISMDLLVSNIEHSCDNMGATVKGALILISKKYATAGNLVNWTPESFGKINQWVRRRGMGKPFDYTLVTRTLDALPAIQTETVFSDYVNSFIQEAKTTQDIHFNQQKYDYKEVL